MLMGRSPRAPILAALAAAALLAGAALLGRGDGAPADDADEAGAAGEEAAATPPDGAGPTRPVTPVAPTGGRTVPADLLAAPAVRAAVERAARDAGVAVADVAVTDVREVTWPSSALGCPQPDRMYLDVLTPGYRVMTFAAGERRIYHTDQGGEGRALVVACEPAVSKAGAVDLPPDRLEAVRADAALRADEPGAPVELVAVAVSSATTLTCDEVAAGGTGAAPGAMSLAGELIWDVTVRVGFRQHRYRVSGSGLVHCGALGVDGEGNPTD